MIWLGAVVAAAILTGRVAAVSAAPGAEDAEPAFAVMEAERLLPSYADGARAIQAHADRRIAVRGQLAAWRALDRVRRAQPVGDSAVGQRPRSAGAGVGTGPGSASNLASGAQFQPVYSELAEVCGVPAAVGLYAESGVTSVPAVLTQWAQTSELAVSPDSGIKAAWTLGPDATNAFAWIPSASPNLVIVVSTGNEPCPATKLFQQVLAGEGW